MSFTVGAWAFPALITIAAFVWALYVAGNERTGSYAMPIAGMLAFFLAVTVSLASWLVWALLS